MIPLKMPNLPRCFNFTVTATYDKYVSFLENLVPCISGFLSGIIFQDFLNVITNSFSREPLTKLKILFEGKARGGEKAQCT